MPFNIEQIYQCLRDFDFANLLVKEMHWKSPINRKPASIDESYTRHEIARIGGVPVLEISSADGCIAGSQVREALYKELSYLFHDSLLIFLNAERSQSVWYWIKHEYNKSYKQEIFYTRGQPEDIFLNMLHSTISDIIVSERPRGARETTGRRRVTEGYATDFNEQRRGLAKQIMWIEDSQDLSLFATLLFCRMIFLYFLQKRGFLNNGDRQYLEEKLRESSEDNYYRHFLCSLFFEGLALPVSVRDEDTRTLLGDVPHLHGPLFRPHAIEIKHSDIRIPNSAFESLFSFFSQHDWRMVNIFTGEDDEVTPNVLGNIFEGWFNQQSGAGSSSTPYEITTYLCRQTIHRLLIDRVNQRLANKKHQYFTSIEDLLENADVTSCRYLLLEILPNLSLLDPTCGSGTFLHAALNTLALIYTGLISRIDIFHDNVLDNWLQDIKQQCSNLNYALKTMIIMSNLYGVDISEEAIVMTQLRLSLSLVASAKNSDELQPLTDEAFHLHVGNSLIGELREDGLWSSQEPQSTEIYNERLITRLKEPRPSSPRVRIRQESNVSIEDIERLKPFHWCYYFPRILNERGGFDIIITLPPWKTAKRQSSTATENLLYQVIFQYQDQNIASSTRLDKLFVERCYSLLRENGYCGVIIPGSIATDSTFSRLRGFLFRGTQVTGLYCFENIRNLFTGIHSQFEIALLSFIKGQSTDKFPVAFSNGEIEEINSFPEQHAVYLTSDFLHSFSPDLLFIGRFTSQEDVTICEKMLKFPHSGSVSSRAWNLRFPPGISIGPLSSVDSIKEGSDPGRLPVYEGEMIHQFNHLASAPRYWINTEGLAQQERGRYSRPSQIKEQWQTSGFHGYHLVYRSIASNHNERTFIATILPPDTMAADTLHFIASPLSLEGDVLLFLTGIFNSFMADFFVRLRSSFRLSPSTVSLLPVPRLMERDAFYFPIIRRAASLVCITEDFKDLWESVMKSSWAEKKVATVFADRERLRAELDGLIAHLYAITEDELVHALRRFPLVADPVKIAVQNAYRDVERGLIP